MRGEEVVITTTEIEFIMGGADTWNKVPGINKALGRKLFDLGDNLEACEEMLNNLDNGYAYKLNLCTQSLNDLTKTVIVTSVIEVRLQIAYDQLDRQNGRKIDKSGLGFLA